MGKHSKLKAAESPTEESNLDLAEKAARLAISTLQAAIEGGDTSPAVTRELGGACRALVTIEAERRAQKKAAQYTAKTVPFEVVMEHLRMLTQDRRSHVVNELLRMDDEGSVLG